LASITIGTSYTGTITQSGSYTVTLTGAFSQSGSNTFTGGSGGISVSSLSLTTGTFTSTGGALTISGSSGFSYTSGTFNANSGTVTYSYAGSQTVAGVTYNNLTIGGSSGTKTLGGAITVNGTLTINSGNTLDTRNSYNYGVTLKGNFTNSGTFTARASIITIGGASTQSIAAFTTTGAVNASNTGAATLQGTTTGGALTVSGANGSLILGGSATYTFNSINISGASSMLDQGCTNTISTTGTFQISGQYTNCGAGTNSSDNLTSGAITVNSGGIFDYVGTGTITLTGSVANAGTLQLWGGSYQTSPAARPTCNTSTASSFVTLTAGGTRTWSGAGTFVLVNISAYYQAGTPTATCYGCKANASTSHNTGIWPTSNTACSACASRPASARGWSGRVHTDVPESGRAAGAGAGRIASCRATGASRAAFPNGPGRIHTDVPLAIASCAGTGGLAAGGCQTAGTRRIHADVSIAARRASRRGPPPAQGGEFTQFFKPGPAMPAGPQFPSASQFPQAAPASGPPRPRRCT